MEQAKVTGVVHLVEPEKTFGAKGFRKRLVVLEQEDGRFSNYVPVEFTQENCALADGFKVGDEVEVTYRLRGRRWDKDGEARYFVNVEAVSVRRLAQASAASVEPDSGPDGGVEDDDIPF